MKFHTKTKNTFQVKKAILLLALITAGFTGFAQTTYGVKVGPNFSGATSKSEGSKEASKMIIGLVGGIYANLPIAPQFYIQPSIMYEGKGAKSKSTDEKIRFNYLTIPVDLLFKPKIPNGSGSWVIALGPYVAYGISAKDTYRDDSGDEITLYPFKKDISGGDASLKRLDAGANMQLGFDMSSGFNVVLDADLGLINIMNHGDSNNFVRNISLGITLGYTFGKY